MDADELKKQILTMDMPNEDASIFTFERAGRCFKNSSSKGKRRLGEMSFALAETARSISIAAESEVEIMKIKLQVVIDAIEEAIESYTSFYDTKKRTRPFICLTHS